MGQKAVLTQDLNCKQGANHMIRVIIGDSERELASVSENWINQQINRRNADGNTVCVRVIIKEGQLNMSLSSASCPQSATRGRDPNRDELAIFNL